MAHTHLLLWALKVPTRASCEIFNIKHTYTVYVCFVSFFFMGVATYCVLFYVSLKSAFLFVSKVFIVFALTVCVHHIANISLNGLGHEYRIQYRYEHRTRRILYSLFRPCVIVCQHRLELVNAWKIVYDSSLLNRKLLFLSCWSGEYDRDDRVRLSEYDIQ